MINKKILESTAGTSNIEDDDTDFQLWRLLDHTAFVVGRLRRKELADYGLTPEQACILDILCQNDGTITMEEVAGVTMRRHNSISTLVNRMANQGLVEKLTSVSDARMYNVLITEKGLKLYRTITRDSISEVFSALSDEEKTAIEKGLNTLGEKACRALNDNG
jgi:DNA-binding MarR family transcriptional regulator